MAEQQEPDASAAIDLAENLKEFEKDPFGGDDDFNDVLKEVKVLEAEAAKSVLPEEEEKPTDPEPEPQEQPDELAPEAEEEEQPEEVDPETEEDDEIDFEDALSEKSTDEEDPDEPEPEVEEEMPKRLSKKGQADWKAATAVKKQLRSELKTMKAEKAAADTELAELREKVAEVEDLRKKAEFVEEAEKELKITRVEASREFKEKVAAPLAAIEQQTTLIAKDNEVSTDKVFDAMAEPDPAERRKLLKAVTEDMDAADSADIFQMAKDTQELLALRKSITDNAAEAAKEIQSKADTESAEEASKRKAEFATTSKDVMANLKKHIPFMEIDEGETADDLFESVSKKLSSTDFEGLDTHTKTLAVASRLFLPRLLRQHAKLTKQVKLLEGRVSKKNASSPSVSTDAPAPDTSDSFDGDIEAAVADHLGSSKAIPMAEVLKNMGG